jgi:hypothetical protein
LSALASQNTGPHRLRGPERCWPEILLFVRTSAQAKYIQKKKLSPKTGVKAMIAKNNRTISMVHIQIAVEK